MFSVASSIMRVGIGQAAFISSEESALSYGKLILPVESDFVEQESNNLISKEMLLSFTVDDIMNSGHSDSDKADVLWQKFLNENGMSTTEQLYLESKDFHMDRAVVLAIGLADREAAQWWQEAINAAYNNKLEDLRNLSKQGLYAEIQRTAKEREEFERIQSAKKQALSQKLNYIAAIGDSSDELCKINEKKCRKFCVISGDKLEKVASKKGLIKYNSETFYVPYGIKSISFLAFKSCRGIKHIVLPSTVETINYNAFSDCKSLETVTMLNIKSIGDFAFSGCDNLERIVIGDCVSYVGESAFWGCEKLSVFSTLQECPHEWFFSWNALSSDGLNQVKVAWFSEWEVVDGVPCESI